MKIKTLWIIPLLSFLVVGCTADNTENTALADGLYSLSVNTASTNRTSLGGKLDNIYPVYWSEEDCIAVNGVQSKSLQFSGDNRSSATFFFDESLAAPYYITYPYYEGSSIESPKVVFLAEQNYVEGTFDQNSAPMCGYATTSSATLKHLSAILRIPIKATSEGTTLDRVVITSESKLAGEFAVNCQTGALTPSTMGTNTITYTLPENFTLSTTTESVLHISIPAGKISQCTFCFIEKSGGDMVLNWAPSAVKAGVLREFRCADYQRGATGTLTAFEVDEKDVVVPENSVYGYVKDSNGNPIQGVAVSDGFSVVQTDEDGLYVINNVSPLCWYIYISLPAEYEVPINNYGQPCFYQRYGEENIRYDFALTPLAGGKEETFALFVLGDPQVDNNTEVNLFKNDAVPGIRKHCREIASTGIPCYAITLGDILSSNKGDNDNYMREPMRDAFAYSKIGLPVFQIMGNHDYTYFTEGQEITDEKSPNINLAAQRRHEEVFGPINYSFDRGNFHIIGMKNIYYTKLAVDGENSYGYGFTPEEYEWLRQDLALVPKTKAVVLCVHGRILSYTSRYYAEAKSLLNEFNEAHVMTGHTHKSYNYDHATQEPSTPKIYEHNVGALCGAWWSSRICGDGVPNGYQVFIGGNDANGSGKIVDWYFMGFYEGMNTRDHQMRLYRGDAVTGVEKSQSNKPESDITGYYGFNFGEDVLLANVYNADPKWVIKVYEDDVHTGNMELIPSIEPAFTSLIGDWTYENPRRFNSGEATSQDMYVVGLFAGVLGLGDSSGPDYCWNDYRRHLYKYKLTNPNNKANIEDIKIKVVAIDRFGNEYTETKITVGTDYSIVAY